MPTFREPSRTRRPEAGPARAWRRSAVVIAALGLAAAPSRGAAQQRYIAQTFSVPAAPTTFLVSLTTTGLTGTGPSTFGIFAWGGSGVSGPAVFSATVPGGELFHSVTLAPRLALHAGETYALLFAENGNGLSSFGFTAHDLYPAGAAYECYPSPDVCAVPDASRELDLAGFATRFSAVPEPRTATLLFGALLLLARPLAGVAARRGGR